MWEINNQLWDIVFNVLATVGMISALLTGLTIILALVFSGLLTARLIIINTQKRWFNAKHSIP